MGRSAKKGAYDPSITNRELKVVTTFKMIRKPGGGPGEKWCRLPVRSMRSPRTTVRNKLGESGTYNLSLTIPLVVADNDDPRRIIYGTLENGEISLIDQPYTEEAAKAALNAAVSPAGQRGSRLRGNVLRNPAFDAAIRNADGDPDNRNDGNGGDGDGAGRIGSPRVSPRQILVAPEISF